MTTEEGAAETGGSEAPAAVRRALTPAQAYQTGIALHRQGRVAEAEQVYRAVLQLAPDHAGALRHLGMLCTRNGRGEEAIGLLRRAVANDPNSAYAHNDLGISLSALRRPQEAVEQYERAVALAPGFADAHNNLGNALHVLARHDAAIASFERALAVNPGFAHAHNNLGNALAALQRHAEAIAHYEQAAVLQPTLAEAFYNHGIALLALGRPERAIAQFEKAIALKPDYPDAHTAIGKALLGLDRRAEAAAHLERALATVPDSAEAHHEFATALAALSRHEEAIAHYRQAIASRPAFAEAHNNLGNLLAALNRHGEAIEHYRRALAIDPNSCEAHNNLGSALLALKRPEEALACFQKALAIRPGAAEPAHNVGMALAALGRYAEAESFYRSIIAEHPQFIAVYVNLAGALVQLDRVDEGIAWFETALARDPGMASAHFGLGHAYVVLGRFAEAQRSLEKAIAIEPGRPDFYRSLVDCRPVVPGDPGLAAMEDMARAIDSLSADQQIELHFGLAKAYADLQQHGRAFSHLLQGNALKRRQVAYDEAAIPGMFDRSQAVFSPELMRRMAGVGCQSDVPVFVVGMPRSGTTLVEQILASHSMVFGAGELLDLPQTAAAVCRAAGSTPFPDIAASLPPDALRRLGTEYLARLTARAPAAARIIDKLPGNFRFAGLIHLALPKARIIHVRRDPIDTCLSCFSKLFSGEQPFAYDLGELGRYYRAYEALMAHWRAVLPPAALLEVQYEELVAELEPQARRIVAFCGLDWDEHCLAFHQTRRPIRTASASQVRQPLYRSAIGRWRPYEPWLGPLLAALGQKP